MVLSPSLGMHNSLLTSVDIREKLWYQYWVLYSTSLFQKVRAGWCIREGLKRYEIRALICMSLTVLKDWKYLANFMEITIKTLTA